jgi:SNF family Na+-dependent transporter
MTNLVKRWSATRQVVLCWVLVALIIVALVSAVHMRQWFDAAIDIMALAMMVYCLVSWIRIRRSHKNWR